MTSPKLQTLIDFVSFTHEIRKVKRMIVFSSDSEYENDAEHCYQLALVAWFLIENDGLQLDTFKVVGMAMVHDIVEAYAGDVSVFASEDELRAKPQKEAEAIEQLKANWPSFTSLHALIQEYERCQTPESKFVYALDKLLPTINNLLYEGRSWKAQDVTLERVKAHKQGKVDISEPVKEYYQQVLDLLESHPELFASKQ